MIDRVMHARQHMGTCGACAMDLKLEHEAARQPPWPARHGNPMDHLGVELLPFKQLCASAAGECRHACFSMSGFVLPPFGCASSRALAGPSRELTGPAATTAVQETALRQKLPLILLLVVLLLLCSFNALLLVLLLAEQLIYRWTRYRHL
jgi:hypothetical protein